MKKPTGAVAKVFWECLPLLPKDNSNDKVLIGLAVSKHVNNEILDENARFMNALTKAVAEGDLDVDTVKNFLDKSKVTLSEKDNQLKYELYIKMFKAMIDTNEMTAEQKKLIETTDNSEFWLNQDYILIRQAVEFFRQNLN